MIGYHFKLDRKKLDAAPEAERTLFLMLGHLANQATILGKWVVWSQAKEGASDLERKGCAAQSVMALSLLSAKLNEGWGLLQKHYYGTGISKIYDPKLEAGARDALKELGRYFGNENAVRRCRDEYAFHYDGNALKAHYTTLPAEEEMDFYLCEFGGANLFHLSETAAAHSLLTNLGKGDRQAGLLCLIEDTLRVSTWFQALTAGAAHVFLQQMGAPDGAEFDIDGLQEFDSVRIPFLTEGP